MRKIFICAAIVICLNLNSGAQNKDYAYRAVPFTSVKAHR